MGTHPLPLQGRIVMVVGAGSSGVGLSNGEAAALAYAAAGAFVVAVDLNVDEARRVAKEVVAVGGASLAVEADISVEGDVRTAIATVVRDVGVPHVLHNNVGVATMGEITELDTEAWNRSISINLTGAFLTAKHLLPPMLDAGRGVITNVSSIASIRHTGYVYPAYSAAKAAINQLTVSMALTYADRGIRANAILPGLIDTPLVSTQITDDPEALAARHALSPTGRMGSPHDVANAAVFLASDGAAYINGVCLAVDGGLSARCG
ncbi:SDR family NAD(P)-dependent oxidoreductase [Oryzobacter telluris]|uniref:SDR family NAD(P)-dependent oxidoreductase n=1 Tax=Oryzobacter telluris TaxID=3149179 RepID=UPI00370DC9BE